MSLSRSEVAIDHRQAVRELRRAFISGAAHNDLFVFEVVCVDLDAQFVASIELQGGWFSHPAEFRSTMGRKSNPAGTAPSRAVLWLRQVAVLGDHLRPPHVAATGIRELMDVHRPGDIRIAMAEQECNFINALAREWMLDGREGSLDHK
jgi:hypothetical protein